MAFHLLTILRFDIAGLLGRIVVAAVSGGRIVETRVIASVGLAITTLAVAGCGSGAVVLPPTTPAARIPVPSPCAFVTQQEAEDSLGNYLHSPPEAAWEDQRVEPTPNAGTSSTAGYSCLYDGGEIDEVAVSYDAVDQAGFLALKVTPWIAPWSTPRTVTSPRPVPGLGDDAFFAAPTAGGSWVSGNLYVRTELYVLVAGHVLNFSMDELSKSGDLGNPVASRVLLAFARDATPRVIPAFSPDQEPAGERLVAVARGVLPVSATHGAQGCLPVSRDACPYTPRLADRLFHLCCSGPRGTGVDPVLRGHEGGYNLDLIADPRGGGGVVHATLTLSMTPFEGPHVLLDIVIVDVDGRLLADDIRCWGQGDASSIYASTLARC